MSPTKAILYCRVSTSGQEEEGYSLDAQVKLLTGYAQEHDVKVAKTFRVSESASGKQIRKVFNEAIDYARENDIPIIICEKIDRLTRTNKDALVVSEWVQEDSKRQVHCAKESFILTQNTRAHENLVRDMKVAIARFYINNLSEEVKKGQKEKIAQGWLPTKPPLGYKTIGEKGKKIHIPDTDTAPDVMKMFELYASGLHSVKSLAKYLYQKGFRSRGGMRVAKSRIAKLLADPFYYGAMRWRGKIHPGKHKPLIGRELYDSVQQIMHAIV